MAKYQPLYLRLFQKKLGQPPVVIQHCSLSKLFLKQTLYKKKNKSVIKMIPFVFWLPWPLVCFDIEYKTLLVGLFNTCLICSNWITTAHKYSRWISPLNYLQWESQTEFAFHFETIINLDFKHHGSNLIWNVINHRLRTPNEGKNQRYLKNWAGVADKICCRHT